MTFRARVFHNGKLTNRVNCPKKFEETKSNKLVHFEDCKTCPFAERIYLGGVECAFDGKMPPRGELTH